MPNKSIRNNRSRVAVIFIFSLALLAAFKIIFISNSYAYKLDVGYVDFPPHSYTTENGTANGTLIELTNRIFNKAGVEYNYLKVPAPRILLNLKYLENYASVGWFKNKEREKFANFSLPIYINKPIGLLVRFKDRHKFSDFSTIASLLENTNYKIGHLKGHSAGPYMEPILKQHPENVTKISGTKIQMIRMLMAGRVDGVILAPEEMQPLIQKSGFKQDNFTHISFDDIPKGNKRYLIFSKSVAPEVIQRINKVILELVGNLEERPAAGESPEK